MRALFLAMISFLLPSGALASTCYAFVEDLRQHGIGVQYAELGATNVQSSARQVSITYVAHSTFRIETEEGVIIATDYFGTAGRTRAEDGSFQSIIPTVVTMNHAHETHWTAFPDERIGHVLRGWDHDGTGPANHQLRVRDVAIRNVTTNIRGWGEPEADGNSIFVFEVADLCIGHLGHLHHKLTEQHYAKLGRLDIVMAPVDGSFTLEISEMIEVLKTLRAQIVLPMHAFGTASLQRFVQGMSDEFATEVNQGATLTVSIETLPSRPTVVLLPTEGSTPDPAFSDD